WGGSFDRDASMSVSTMFAWGLAIARRELKIWAFMGDGAFCMNPGMLMVERELSPPNLTHFLVSNRVYGATSNADLPNLTNNDYGGIARAVGPERGVGVKSHDGPARRAPARPVAESRRPNLSERAER